MTSLMTRLRAAYGAFWNPAAGGSGAGHARQRLARYAWLWGLYWNTAYDDIGAYLATKGAGAKLYRHTRGLRNPVGRWVDFYVANVWGGMLDLAAGDGSREPSALPIVTDNPALRPAIAKVWQWSNWAAKRNLATLYSTTLGDVILKVVDRPAARKVYIQPQRPDAYTELEADDFGFVKRAVIEEDLLDAQGRSYTYREVIEHPSAWGGPTTRFSTFRNGQPHGYAENDGQAVWEVPYDFVPVVRIPWQDVGEAWGVVGYVKALAKIDSVNALASQLADQIGKAVNTPLVAYGIAAGNLTVRADADGVPVVYVPNEAARLEPLLGPLNLSEALASIDAQLADIKDDLPALKLAEALRSGMSGEALGRAFADVVAQVQAVRGNHDAGLVRAQQMAIAIAGASGYDPVFRGFDLASYAAGKLDHAIGSRPVLPRTPDEELAAMERRWKLVNDLAAGGEVPLETALIEVLGWGPEKLREFGQQRAAAILLAQEDAVTGLTQ